MHTTLNERTENPDGNTPCQRYVTIDNAGHCPNHEAPTAVAKVLESWLGAPDRSTASLITGGKESIHEPWGDVMLREVSIEESESIGFVDKIVSSMVG